MSILLPPKACLKVYLFFLFCFFCFCLPFQKSIFYLLFIHQPLFTEDSLCFFFFCLPFPFLRFACLFDTSFPNIPFLKSNVLSFLAVLFFCCSCFCFDCVCFSLSVFCCYVGFVFGVFCLVLCFVFVFFLVLVSVYEKKLFSLQFWCFFELCWLKG